MREDKLSSSEQDSGEDSSRDKKLSPNLLKNISFLKCELNDVDIIQYRSAVMSVNKRLLEICFVYSDGVVNSEVIDGFILKPLMDTLALDDPDILIDFLINRVIPINGAKKIGDFSEVVNSISYGDSLLMIDGYGEAVLFDTKMFVTRGISEPDGEKILSGPREGFSEAIMQNLSLIRRKLRTSDLKMKYLNIGKKSNTQICVTYMKSIVKKEILEDLYRRLSKIDIDAVLDAHYITELIRDEKWSVFRTTGYTERPDIVAAKLLEGRIAVFIDGTPVVLTIPYLFIENFQSNEDYYLSFYYASFSRMIRMAGFLLAVMVPALYIAVVSFHHEMLPTTLMINIATDTHNVPLPASLEALLLLLMFDILRETGIRMPLGIGQALSIVGALVVGSAAVEADLVSAPMIIVTAISGITSLLIPKMNAPILLIRLAFLILASFLGLYGVVMGFSVMLIHILTLDSFGVPQFMQDERLKFQRMKDTFVRSPWSEMITRPLRLTKNKVRQSGAEVSSNE